MTNKNRIPEIRFKGFEETWGIYNLGNEISDIIGGGTPSTSNPDYWNGNIDWYSPTEIGEKIYANGSEKKITKLGLENSSAKILPYGRTILFTSRASIGDMAILQHSGATNQGFQSLVLKKGYDTYFVYSMRYLIKQYAKKYSSGSTFLEISGKLLGKMEITAPSYKEQSQIGTFFKNLDQLITINKSKYDKLVNVKKAMLEKMFPKKGSNVPEIRFKGFTGAWKEKEIKELAERYDNLRVPITATDRVSGNTPYYGANGVQDYVKGYTHDGEFILVAEDGANDLKNYPVQYVNGKIWVNNHVHVLQGNISFADNSFLKYNISQTNIKPFLVGGGRAKLNADTMMKINIPIPSKIDEQHKIGSFFKNLDDLLTLQKRELEKLKNIKKACLEKMFV